MLLARKFNNAHLRLWAFLGLCLVAGLVVSAARGQADDASSKPSRMENRFLFVVENSSSMKSRAKGVEQAIAGLLNSGMKGELRKGDTIGLWSYDDRVHPEFPMQVWSDENKGAIVEAVQRYLRHLRYEKQGRLEKAWPALRQALAKSERLTIIFINDGEETWRGTPFDQEINGLRKHYRDEFRAGNWPVVTVFSARDGGLSEFTINYPDSINVPHTADPLPPPVTNAPPVVAAASPPAPTPAAPPAESKPLRTIEIVRKSPDVVVPPPAPVEVPPPVATPPPIVINEAVSAPATLPAPEPPPQPVAPAVTTNANVAATPAPPVLPPNPMPVTIASTGQRAALFVIAISLLTIAVALVFFLLRRSRGPQSSLISQSLERPR